jgi:hypothetical protein
MQKNWLAKKIDGKWDKGGNVPEDFIYRVSFYGEKGECTFSRRGVTVEMLRTMFADGTTRSAERRIDNFTDRRTKMEAFFEWRSSNPD